MACTTPKCADLDGLDADLDLLREKHKYLRANSNRGGHEGAVDAAVDGQDTCVHAILHCMQALLRAAAPVLLGRPALAPGW